MVTEARNKGLQDGSYLDYILDHHDAGAVDAASPVLFLTDSFDFFGVRTVHEYCRGVRTPAQHAE